MNQGFSFPFSHGFFGATINFISSCTIRASMRKECIVFLVLLLVTGTFFHSFFIDSIALDTQNAAGNSYDTYFFNQTDIPTWTLGDTWTYESSVFFEGENGSFDGFIQNMVQTVVELVNLTQNETTPFFVVNLSGTISGELTYGIITGDLEGTIQGKLCVRSSDLAIISTEIISWGEIDALLFTFDYGLNSTLLFNPPLENYDFPLKLEDNWEVFSQVTSQGSFYIEDLINESLSGDSLMGGFMEFINIQNISVPAGIFESCLLNSLGNESFDYWYSPLVKNSIKSIVNMSSDNSTVNLEMNLTSYSLMDQQINITHHFMPPSVYANEHVNITGEVRDTSTGNVIPNAPVFLRLPYNNQVWNATTNNLGYYHTLIMAPLIYDNTSSNDDIGSDGIIAWTSGDYGEGYRIATLTIKGINCTFVLNEGWNLISLPTDNIWTAETLGENITGCSVVTMLYGNNDTFVSHVVGTPYDDFPILDGVGYFIYLGHDSYLNMTGLPITTVNVPIYNEWNLIGWYYDSATTAESLGQHITGCDVVSMFNGSTQTFLSHVVGSPHDNFLVTQGMGLFIFASETSMWHGEG